MSEPFDDAGDDEQPRDAAALHVRLDRLGRWSVMASGFKEAADQLVKDIMFGQGVIDFLVYPILANYRHSIELALKGQVRELNVLLGVPPPAKPKRAKAEHGAGYDLLALWDWALKRAPRTLSAARRIQARTGRKDGQGIRSHRRTGGRGALSRIDGRTTQPAHARSAQPAPACGGHEQGHARVELHRWDRRLREGPAFQRS